MAAALCLYYLIADGEDGAEVLLAANSKEQAKIAFDMCSKFSKGLDSKGKYLTAYRADILFNLTNSKLKVLAADDSKLDGLMPVLVYWMNITLLRIVKYVMLLSPVWG